MIDRIKKQMKNFKCYFDYNKESKIMKRNMHQSIIKMYLNRETHSTQLNTFITNLHMFINCLHNSH
jgi:hypothetical protein